MPLTARGTNAERPSGELTNSGVGGVQMADVSVDVETGVVKVNKMVAVQDCGLVIDLKLAESQVYGALIMGVSYALYEEKVMDPATGRMLNPNMEFYKLAGIGDIGELVVHMMTGRATTSAASSASASRRSSRPERPSPTRSPMRWG